MPIRTVDNCGWRLNIAGKTDYMDKSEAVASETSKARAETVVGRCSQTYIEHDREQGPANEPCFLESIGLGRVSFPDSVGNKTSEAEPIVRKQRVAPIKNI